MKNSEGFIRELGHAEYFYYMCNRLAPTNFVIVAELTGIIQEDRLSRAVNTLFKAYDIFQVKIGWESSTKPAFYHTEYRNIDIRVIRGNRSSLDSAILEEMNAPMSPEWKPLRLVMMNNCDSKTQSVLFTFNHLFNDATSAIMLVQKVLAFAVSGGELKEIQQIELAPNLEQLLPAPLHGISFLKAIISMIRRVRSKEKKYGKLGHTVSGKYNFHSRNISFEYAGLGERDTTRLIETAREMGFTVHHLLCAIQLMVVRRFYREKGILPLTLSMPVSLRGKLQSLVEKDSPGLYISIPKLTIPVSETPVLEAVANEIKSDLQLILKSKELFILWRLLPRSKFPVTEKGVNYLNTIFSKNTDSSMITNLGKVPLWPGLESRNPIHFLNFAVAPPKDAMCCISVSTFMGKMGLSFCFNRDLLSREDCRRLFEDFKTELSAISN